MNRQHHKNDPQQASSQTRRDFIKSSLGTVAAAGAAASNHSTAAAGRAGDDEAAVVPQGELAERIKLTEGRFYRGRTPSFTRDFILADVSFKMPRRFTEFSGDASGRLVEALSIRPVAPPAELAALVDELISYQRPDGRFGNPALVFDAQSIGGQHMALLWGNGRLLIGLMEYHRRNKDPKILATARRLGDFLLTVERDCSAREVRKRLEGQGAMGFICFTQLVEGLVRLAETTGDQKYLETARHVVPLLEGRGIQHAHGYLATLRGFVDLAVGDRDETALRHVETAYSDLVESPDYTVFGSVLEYFGWDNRKFNQEDFKVLKDASGGDPRDEGCGHADFLRLSLALWRQTGKQEYLERAERCYLNGLLPNQFSTGDFGSRVTSRTGLKPTDNVDRAWWCCTMHGYRAFPDVLDSAITVHAGQIRINLLEELDWKMNDFGLSSRALGALPGGEIGLSMTVTQGGARKHSLAFRQPGWAAPLKLTLNGAPITGVNQDGYNVIEHILKTGDRLEAKMRCLARFQSRDGKTFGYDQMPVGTSEAALFWGPWLMGVDEGYDALFFGEPWTNNMLRLPNRLSAVPAGRFHLLRFNYTHDGFSGTESVTLRPISRYGLDPQRILAVWLKYHKA